MKYWLYFIRKKNVKRYVCLFTHFLILINPIVLFEDFLFGRFCLKFLIDNITRFFFRKFTFCNVYPTISFTFLRNFVNVFQSRVLMHRFFWLGFSLRAFFSGEYRFRCSIPILGYIHIWHKTGYTRIFYGN